MISKILHFIWVGDDARRPDNCIDTWVRHHPDWTIKIWDNASLSDNEWVNAAHMRAMFGRELNGVADMMRWEILYNEGGIVLDADSICLRPLDDSLLDCDAFACWESEIARPGLIAAGYVGCSAGNEFIGQIILDIQNEVSVVNANAWQTVGPQRLTDSYRRYHYHALRILPSHYFIPEHFTGLVYDGPGPVYAHQLWGSTRNGYAELHLQQFDDGLKHLVKIVKDTLRSMDVIARFGGEEFLILLPETTVEAAAQTMTRLQRELTKHFFLHENEKLLITFSAGVALRIPNEGQAALVARADKAMYVAKKSGKNRVIVAD